MMDFDQSGVRVTKILLRAQDDPNVLQELEQFRRTLVVMFSDIQGSTAYFEKHGDAAGLFMVRQCNDIIRRSVEKHGGVVVKTIGDGAMATFPEAKAAVDSAIEIQCSVAGNSGLCKDQIALRIGIHCGTGIVSTNDVFGDVVNVASRVESVAKPRQIVLSEESYERVREDGFMIEKLGRFSLKGKAQERTLFQVKWDYDPDPGTEVGFQVPPTRQGAPNFKLRAVGKDGNVGAEYPVHGELAIRISQDGRLFLSHDPSREEAFGRVFLESDQLFIETGKGGNVAIFQRLSGSYVLEDGDVFLAGKQMFLYEEQRSETFTVGEAATVAIADLLPPTNTARLTRIDTAGQPLARYTLSEIQLQFGRTRGDHVFPDDHLMSRGHFRISSRGEDYVLEDLGSRNGTFVKVVRKTHLFPGGMLIIGNQLLEVAS